jgi:hypothetical protein
LILISQAFAQRNDQLKALNTYVNFTNESIHGILTIHRLLENFNQEVNKFVDLPGYRINNISNSDLPLNIFKDDDHWFYSVTPYEWFDKIKQEKNILGEQAYNKLFPIADEMFVTNNNINKIRFDVANFIASTDLTQKENLDSVYFLLEKAVDLIDLFYALQMNMEDVLNSEYSKFSGQKDVQNPFLELYDASKELLLNIRVTDENNTTLCIEKLREKLESAKNENSAKPNPKSKVTASRILQINDGILKLGNELVNTPELAEEYKLYGNYYFYYNVRIIEKFNRYGNGFVGLLNNLIDIEQLPVPHRLEFPHYFKVIYPKRIDKQIETIASSVSDIKTLPAKLAGREVKKVAKELIIADTMSLEIELYDFKIQDGDIVSINFNGDWIYEKLSLETKPKKFILDLNRSGRNYIILHAVNVGRRPPNTIGLNYTYHGNKKTIVLQSDLNSSEMVEIKLDEKEKKN